MKQKSTFKPSEHQIQSAFFTWVRMMAQNDDRYLNICAVPNGGKRSAITGAILKAEGVSPGYLDVIGDLDHVLYNGFRIEFKKEGGKLSDEQKNWITRLRAYGRLLCVVCYSTQEAIDFVKEYMKGVANVGVA